MATPRSGGVAITLSGGSSSKIGALSGHQKSPWQSNVIQVNPDRFRRSGHKEGRFRRSRKRPSGLTKK